MTWYWYIERPDEIMCDLDRVSGAQLRALSRLIEASPLDVESVWLYPSESEWHHHLIVRLRKVVMWPEVVAWSLVFGNDPRRAARSILRWNDLVGLVPPSLLISPRAWIDFYRPSDHECRCKAGHDQAQMELCPVGSRLRPRDELEPAGSIGEAWKGYGKVQ